jgi:hypothetical protein
MCSAVSLPTVMCSAVSLPTVMCSAVSLPTVMCCCGDGWRSCDGYRQHESQQATYLAHIEVDILLTLSDPMSDRPTL